MVSRIEVRLITSGPIDRKLVSQPCQVVPRPIWTCRVNTHTDCTCTALALHIIKNESRLGSQKYLKKIFFFNLYKLARYGQFYLWIPFSKVYMDILTKTFFEFSRTFEKNHLFNVMVNHKKSIFSVLFHNTNLFTKSAFISTDTNLKFKMTVIDNEHNIKKS